MKEEMNEAAQVELGGGFSLQAEWLSPGGYDLGRIVKWHIFGPCVRCDRGESIGTIPIEADSGPVWEVRNWSPLTLDPSIRVSAPDHECYHGFVREGKWVPA